jgi:hypothetical protein
MSVDPITFSFRFSAVARDAQEPRDAAALYDAR